MLADITPVILAYNEEHNLRRTLQMLKWAKEILIVDSGSHDATLDICQEFNNTRVVYNPFESFAAQCNFALQQSINSEWVLSMDADYVLSDALVEELRSLYSPPEINGYRINFQYLINGQALRGSLYPPRVCLYRKDKARYQQDGHAHKVAIEGEISQLSSLIQHDDRKPYARWIASQHKYADQEAHKLKMTNWQKLSWPDRCRKSGLGPLLVLPYTLIVKGLILDGSAGLEYSRQRLTAELLLFKALFIQNKTRP